MKTSEKPQGLSLLRAPFEAHQMSKLPKGTKAQNTCPDDQKINCSVCGGWHHPRVRHLDYVGHAAITDRLLDCDEAWHWEPIALTSDGLPALDADGGLWIRLTVCGVSRIGYGNAKDRNDASSPGDRIKEVIGDAIRNAAMRFGAALDLWHKGELHPPADDDGSNGAQRIDGRPPRLPDYSPDSFEENFPAWSEAVKSGKRTAAQIVAMISTKGVLSEDQRTRLTCLENAG